MNQNKQQINETIQELINGKNTLLLELHKYPSRIIEGEHNE